VHEIPSALQQELPDLENVENFHHFSCLRAILALLDPNPESDPDPLYCKYNRMWTEEYKTPDACSMGAHASSFLITITTWSTGCYICGPLLSLQYNEFAERQIKEAEGRTVAESVYYMKQTIR
jgi:hypothetical protein